MPLARMARITLGFRLRRVPGSGLFWWTDKLLKLYDSLPRQPGRARARSRVVDWIVARQEADGSWGGIQPPWVYALIALNLEGMSTDHPAMRRGLAGLEGFALEDEGGWGETCYSYVDSSFAGVGPSTPSQTAWAAI